MALKKPAAPAAPAPGKFEDETPAVATAAPKADEAQAAVEATVATAKAAASASTAVAKVSAGSLAHAIKADNMLVQMRDAIPAVDFGTFPRLIGANGNVCVKTDNSKVLGDHVDIQLLSWSETFVVSPGSDSEEAKKLVEYSRDGVTIDDSGESVESALKRLREVEGYKDASKKKYIELIGFLQKTAKGDGPIGEIVQVSLSPQSLLSFQAHMANIAVKVRLGQITGEGADQLRVTAEPKSGNGKNWTILKVGAQPK